MLISNYLFLYPFRERNKLMYVSACTYVCNLCVWDSHLANLYFIAPGPPSNVTLVSDSQHSIVVFITPPVPAEQNGVIRGYTVFYRETNLLPEEGYLSLNTSNSTIRFINLTVFTEYSFKVAAYTSAGQGQHSQLKRIFSQEGSMSIDLLHLFLHSLAELGLILGVRTCKTH